MAMAAIFRSAAKKKKCLQVMFSSSLMREEKKHLQVHTTQTLASSSILCSKINRSFGLLPSSSSPTIQELKVNQFLHKGPIMDLSAQNSAGLSLEMYQRMFRSISTMSAPTLSPPLSDGKGQPVPSPLTMVPMPSDSAKTTPTAEPVKRAVQAVLKKIKESPKKVNLVASLVRGMRVEDALAQLAVLQKRAARTVKRVVSNARANATHNHGLNGDRLYVAEAFVGKGKYLKRISMHAKGRSGIMHHPSCRLTVVVKELNEDQETQIVKYQSMTFRERSKVKSKLFPHKLIEVTPQWSRRSKESASGTLDT